MMNRRLGCEAVAVGRGPRVFRAQDGGCQARVWVVGRFWKWYPREQAASGAGGVYGGGFTKSQGGFGSAGLGQRPRPG